MEPFYESLEKEQLRLGLKGLQFKRDEMLTFIEALARGGLDDDGSDLYWTAMTLASEASRLRTLADKIAENEKLLRDSK